MTNTDLIARLRQLNLAVADDAADALTAAQARIEEFEGLLRGVIETWDWCREYPCDRGYGPASDAVYNALAALDATDNT